MSGAVVGYCATVFPGSANVRVVILAVVVAFPGVLGLFMTGLGLRVRSKHAARLALLGAPGWSPGAEAEGRVALEGVAERLPDQAAAPLSGTKAAWWSVRVEAHAGGRSAMWQLVDEERAGEPLVLRHEGGAAALVRVAPNAAVEAARIVFEPDSAETTRYLESHTSSKAKGNGRRLRCVEVRVDVREPVYANGDVAALDDPPASYRSASTSDAPRAALEGRSAPLLLSTRGADALREASERARSMAATLMGIGLVLATAATGGEVLLVLTHAL